MSYIGKSPTAAPLTSSDITDGIISTAKLADDAVTTAKTSYNDIPFRNLVINGDMQIAQRATSTASITGNGYHTIDRWQTNCTAGGTWTQSQDTTVPTGQGFAKSLKMDCTTADGSLAAGDRLIIQQAIEGQNLQHLKKGTSSAESLTVSFWVYATKTGTNICELYDADNTRQISKSYTIDTTNTWEKKTITFAGDTTGAFGNDNGASLYLNFYLCAGSTYSSGTLNTSWASNTNANRAVGQVNHADSTSNNFYITGVQLEVGQTSSDFEFVPHDINWLRCLRYCIAIGNAPGGTTYNYADNSIIGYYYNNTDFYPNYFYPVPMRATPGVTFSGTGSGLGVVYSDSAGDTTTSNGTNVTSNTNLNFRCSTSQSNQTYGGAFDFSADQYALLSAEL
mgnify:CR=1 FL=1